MYESRYKVLAESEPRRYKVGKRRRFSDKRVLATVQRLQPIVKQLSVSMSQLALAWVLRPESVSSAIIGAIRPEQIEENAMAADISIDRATERAIDAALAEVLFP